MTGDAPPEAGPQIQIQAAGLGKRFGDFWAVKNVSFGLARSEIAVFIGGSGAGKTTLLKLLIGLERPSEGSISIDGEDTAQLGERKLNRVRRKLGMVFQYSALLDSMDVFENVAFPLREHKPELGTKKMRELVRERLAALGLHDIEDKRPSELSGGMRKRVALARALMLDPQILLYDEPTSGLDPLTARLVDDMIVETRDRFGVTSVVISHDMAGALRIADRIYVLDKGQLVTTASPAELLRSEVPLVRNFLEASGIATERLPAALA